MSLNKMIVTMLQKSCNCFKCECDWLLNSNSDCQMTWLYFFFSLTTLIFGYRACCGNSRPVHWTYRKIEGGENPLRDVPVVWTIITSVVLYKAIHSLSLLGEIGSKSTIIGICIFGLAWERIRGLQPWLLIRGVLCGISIQEWVFHGR